MQLILQNSRICRHWGVQDDTGPVVLNALQPVELSLSCPKQKAVILVLPCTDNSSSSSLGRFDMAQHPSMQHTFTDNVGDGFVETQTYIQHDIEQLQ